MTRVAKLLLAAVLALAALAGSTPRASAINWCQLCAQTGSCVDCCACDGASIVFCEQHC